MPEKLVVGGGASAKPGRSGPPKKAPKAAGIRREVPQALLIAVIVVVVLALGAGAYYVINGGWATPAQMEAKFQHETFPLVAAKRGDMEPLEKENARRKAAGLPPLQLKEDRHESMQQAKQKLLELQQKLGPSH
ncbi:MAG: hypothetical protein ACP5VE_02320 [Chthonomonadales bacterium]